MYALLALVSAVIAIGSFYFFQTSKANEGTLYLVLGIVFALAAAFCGVMFLSGRVNKTDDIHITE
jgi:hypothetical protein